MPYTLPALPFPSNALEPHIDQQTMEIHHGKHHQAYVNNLNAAIQKHLDAAFARLAHVYGPVIDIHPDEGIRRLRIHVSRIGHRMIERLVAIVITPAVGNVFPLLRIDEEFVQIRAHLDLPVDGSLPGVARGSRTEACDETGEVAPSS